MRLSRDAGGLGNDEEMIITIENFHRLCRKASYKRRVVAVATLRESAAPCIGMRTLRSAECIHVSESPSCSVPTAMAIPPVRLASVKVCLAEGVAATILILCC